MLNNRTMTLDQLLKDKLDQREQIEALLTETLAALTEKGYNPINQVVGYLISGDPAYISNHKDARSKIGQVERDEIMEVLLTHFIEQMN